MKSMKEFKLAFKMCWMVLSLVAIAAVILPGCLSAGEVARITPRCERKTKLGTECFFCGMTTGFIRIAHGRWEDAGRSNRGALPLYAGFAGNGACLAFALIKSCKIGKKKC